MNILYINHYAGSQAHGMSFRTYYLAKEWVAAGHEVLVLAASFSHIRAVQPAVNARVLVENLDGVCYRWYKTPKYFGNGVGRVFNILKFISSLGRDAKFLADTFKPDVVICSSTYPMDIWPGRKIARFSGARLIFELHDLWPVSPMEIGGMSRWHPFILWVSIAERSVYKYADKVISILPKTFDYLASRGLPANKFAHVPNGVRLQDWAAPTSLPRGVSQLLAKLKSENNKIVGYAGTYGLSNALDTLLDAAKILLGKSISIVFVGVGPEEGRLRGRVHKEGLRNVFILPSVPKTSVPTFLRQVDVAYIGWSRNPLYKFGISPNKIFDYMMAGVPIVHSVEAGNDPVAEVGCGISVPPGDAEAVAQAIQSLLALPAEKLAQLGQLGIEYVRANHTYSVLAQKFLMDMSSN